MHSVGTKVVHPCYGAGTIVSLDSKRIGATEHKYYVIEMLDAHRTTQIMVPIKSADDMGLRRVGRLHRLRELLCDCRSRTRETPLDKDYRTRQVQTLNLLKSGSFRLVLDMVCCLKTLNARRTLSYTDRTRFDQAKKMLASELALSADECIGDALVELEERLAETPVESVP